MPLGPLVFTPYLRPQVWGGRRLADLFGKHLPTPEPYGESWEISEHSHNVTRVADGPHAGLTLTDLCRKHADELFGPAVPADGRFPLLIKLLDCEALLSIQVHPDDALAREILVNERGKTEAWVILDVGPNGRVFAGLKEGVDRPTLLRHLQEGTTDQCLHSFRPKAGDCLFIRSGTVHAVGGGVVIAEVQQSSDATFRLFDWNRVGADGKPRKLHIDESLRSIDFSAGPLRPVVAAPLANLPDRVTGEALVECGYFQMDRFYLRENGQLCNPFVGRLSIWMMLSGSARLSGNEYDRKFQTGGTVLVPASAGPVEWRTTDAASEATLLGITLPS